MFRVINAEDFVNRFASDRSHMAGSGQAYPSWPAIRGPDATSNMNLDDYINMVENIGGSGSGSGSDKDNNSIERCNNMIVSEGGERDPVLGSKTDAIVIVGDSERREASSEGSIRSSQHYLGRLFSLTQFIEWSRT